MSQSEAHDKHAGEAQAYQPLPAILSYLVPGLGQVYQGRVAKGVLFFVCLYLLFFYGMYLGSGSVTLERPGGALEEYRIVGNVYLPDVYRENTETQLPRLAYNLYHRPQMLAQVWIGVAAWPAIYQYLAYDPTADGPLPLRGLMRAPSETTVNAVQTTGNKIMDLGWVFTVLAGVLNILVIYDALAGPALQPVSEPESLAKATA